MDGQDEEGPDHEQTGEPENSTEFEHVENKERNGEF